ncbi:hypothetical protein BH09PAT3_BH09PAT3_5630 [soil metagenome]
MDSVLLLSALLSVANLTLWLSVIWPYRRPVAYLIVLAEIAAVATFIYDEPTAWAVLFATVTVYKLINAARIIKGRMQVDYLRRVTCRAGILLTAMQLILCICMGINDNPDITSTAVYYGLAGIQLIGALILLSSTSRHLKTTKTLQATTAYADRDLPSLSVLIPARNETDDLRACLDALIASDYPKLEIIVLDDCSQDKHTPEIIRSFAHDGVRFVPGIAPNESWLAKNYAYQQLADAASGEYLLYCGVDLRLTPGAIRELITTMLEKKKTMLSILPQNSRPKSLRTYLIQPTRYAWELSLPRRLFNRPPVLSTCWIIKRTTLVTAGSFKATSRSIVPESYFARAAARHDGYSFLRSNMAISDKPVIEQQATALRMRYPQLRRRLELVWLVTIIELLCVVLPLPFAIALFIMGMPIPATIALLAYLVGYTVFLQVSGVMYGRAVIGGVIAVPLSALVDIFLLNYSMYKYEFSDIQWKDRNICLPIMRFDTPTTTPQVSGRVS